VRVVGIVRSRTQTTEFSLVLVKYFVRVVGIVRSRTQTMEFSLVLVKSGLENRDYGRRGSATLRPWSLV
jgi:hypothetical protein